MQNQNLTQALQEEDEEDKFLKENLKIRETI